MGEEAAGLEIVLEEFVGGDVDHLLQDVYLEKDEIRENSLVPK